MLKIAVFASGSGTNFESIVKSSRKGILSKIVHVETLICDIPDAGCLTRAKKLKIPAHLIPHTDFSRRERHEEEIFRVLGTYRPELIVLAGYMRILTPAFIRRIFRRDKGLPGLMNIHPALLPAFAGTSGYEDAFNYGVKVSGVTVHYVDEGMDTGPIILQEAVPIMEEDTLDTFRKRGLEVEHRLYPEAIRLDALGGVRIEGRKVKILTG
jgi:phosphoribosylglycinamide formyltransferase 1